MILLMKTSQNYTLYVKLIAMTRWVRPTVYPSLQAIPWVKFEISWFNLKFHLILSLSTIDAQMKISKSNIVQTVHWHLCGTSMLKNQMWEALVWLIYTENMIPTTWKYYTTFYEIREYFTNVFEGVAVFSISYSQPFVSFRFYKSWKTIFFSKLSFYRQCRIARF